MYTLFITLMSIFKLCHSFYLPGLAPVNYCKEEEESLSKTCQSKIPVFVNKLDSVQAVMPYDYGRFHLCTAEEDLSPPENLGQVVFGERIRSSPYTLQFMKEEKCKRVCTKTYSARDTASASHLKFLKNGIKLEYQHHWIVDNLPVVWCYPTESGHQYCSPGFPLGCYVTPIGEPKGACAISDKFNQPDTFYLFNHVDFVVTYHNGENTDWGSSFSGNGGRIVSVKIEPRSIKHSSTKDGEGCERGELLSISNRPLDKNIEITYSYSVYFKPNNDIKWSSRWDYILEAMPHSKIQWFSIVNSLIIVMFLSGMMAVILFRTLYKDIARYNRQDLDDTEEFGWKLVHGDVFRPPRYGMTLTVFVGSGFQLSTMTVITLICACLGFFSPANRGALMTCLLVVYVLLGTCAGYISARFYKMIGGQKWKSNVLLTALLCPAVTFVIYFFLNLILWGAGSSGAVPFTTMIALISLWGFISVPLCFLGAFFGFRKPVMENPVRTNQIPRQIPPQNIYTNSTLNILMGGILPFGCIFIQLFFILNSIWSTQVFYMFGLLFLVVNILIVTCSETAILLCYFQLCSENYQWWWRSFLSTGSTALYLFIYSVHYFFARLEIQGIGSAILYFGYTFIIVWLVFLLTGSIGFLACYVFVRKIYSFIKVD